MGAYGEGWNPSALEGFLAEAQSLSGLVRLTIKDWVVLQKNTFDLHANNEPHSAQTLHMEKATGRYLHRIFGRTIRDGRLDNPSGLKDLTQEIFEHSRVCQGFHNDVKVEPGITLAPGFHPYPRKIGPHCQLFFKDPYDQATVCPDCTRALPSNVVDPVAEAISDLLEETNTHVDLEESDVSLADILGIETDLPETSLWPEGNPRKKIKYAESDYNSVDEDEEENTSVSTHGVCLGSKRIVEELDPQVGIANPTIKTAVKKATSVDTELDKRRGLHCTHCNMTFSKIVNYRSHRAKLRLPERKIPCKDCGRAHYSFDALAQHMMRKHNKLPTSLRNYIKTNEEIKTMKKPLKCSLCKVYCNGHVMVYRHRTLYHELGNYECTDCNRHFLTYYHLVLHNFNYHSRVSPFLEPSTEGLELVKHPNGTTEFIRKGYVCLKCGKVFTGDGEWGKHMKIHHAWSIFICEPCDEMCHYATDFLAHLKNFHEDKSEIKCPICSAVFYLKKGSEVFMAHFKSCAKTLLPWRQAKPGQCERCGRKFSNNYLLQCHLKSHDGYKEFLCDKCDYGTNLKAVMLDHQRMHLRTEGETHDADGHSLYLLCDQCPQKVTSRNALKLHIRCVHEGLQRNYKCSDCDLTFDYCTKLYVHKREVHGFVTTKSRRGRQPQ